MTEIIYGINPVMSALENDIKIKEIYLNEKKFENEISKFQSKGIIVKPLSNFDFEKNDFDQNINVQGIIAVITPKSLLSTKEIIIRSQKTENPVLVLADKITDPQNLGAIIRNVAAFNAQGLIIGKHNQSPITPTVHKASAGNTFNIDIAATNSMSNTIKELKDNGFWIVDTRMDGNMTIESLKEYDEPLVIVMGSEGKGISPAIAKKADMSLKIEMSGKAESLNVAAASAIILHGLQKK